MSYLDTIDQEIKRDKKGDATKVARHLGLIISILPVVLLKVT